jgi:hypothetical protein
MTEVLSKGSGIACLGFVRFNMEKVETIKHAHKVGFSAAAAHDDISCFLNMHSGKYAVTRNANIHKALAELSQEDCAQENKTGRGESGLNSAPDIAYQLSLTSFVPKQE